MSGNFLLPESRNSDDHRYAGPGRGEGEGERDVSDRRRFLLFLVIAFACNKSVLSDPQVIVRKAGPNLRL